MKRHWKIIIILIFLSFTGIGIYIYHWEFREPLLEVHFFSLNKGRSIFIRTPENKTILIGAGQNSEVIREITKVMPFYSRKINTVIIPSAVPQQIGGLIEIIDRYNIDEIIMPKILATSTALAQLMKKITTKKVHIEEVERGDEINIEKDLIIRVLFPYNEFKFNKSSLPELGASLVHRNTSAYFFGNLSKTIQKDILKNVEINEGTNIIEFFNSMADSKVSAELLEKIKPEFTFSNKEKTMHLISNGEKWQKR